MVLIALSGILIQDGPVGKFIQKYQCIQMKYIICKQHINHKMLIYIPVHVSPVRSEGLWKVWNECPRANLHP